MVEDRGAEVEVSEVDRPKECILRHNSIEGDVEGRQRGDVGRRRAGGMETVTTRSSAHASQDVGVERAEVTWGEERGGTPLSLYDTVIVCGGGKIDVHRAEGVGGLYQLNQLIPIADGPLRPEGALDGGPKCEGLTCGVDVEDRGRGGGG